MRPPANHWARLGRNVLPPPPRARRHPQQLGTLLPDGRHEFKRPYSQDPERVMDLLKHGRHCEVVGPATLKARVRAELPERLETLQALAERAGCTRQMLSMIENGKATPSADRLAKLAVAPGCDMNDLHAALAPTAAP